MWSFCRYVILLSIMLLAGCSSTSQVLRPAPQGGVSVKGLNILFSMVPLDTVTTSGTYTPPVTQKASPGYLTGPRPHTEKFRDELGKSLVQQLKEKGISSNFVSQEVIPGVTSVPLRELFPADSLEMHTLLITPIRESRYCGGGSACSTAYTVSISLRTPRDNRELWNYRLQQSENTVADVVPFRNKIFIDDIVEAVLAVLVRN